MKAKKTTIPTTSLVNTYLPVDYFDVFVSQTKTNASISPDDILVKFWVDMPGWINALFKLRNFLVKFVGLKKSSKGRDMQDFETSIREGTEYGFTSISAKNNNETVMLLTDKHLSAYMSVYVEDKGEKKSVFVITLVNFHNKLGRFYFAVIKPFHALVIKGMLKHAIEKTTQKFMAKNTKHEL